MISLRPVLSIASLLMVASSIWAAEPVDHTKHHPASASASAKVDAATESANKVSMQKIDDQIKSMHDMHENMMNAKSPEERSALMADHMKAMQAGMAMMGKMADDKKAQAKGGMQKDMSMHKMMEKRMEMMEGMMQMMMDRMPASTAITK
ncbi:hypothetical protein UNDYM_2603 [Undibacterium sp. YM2]|uniref:hypothetical protein n=1 Tax=Undibacterium sp. YM2 TaxID=2058625 RepID=UPI001331F7A5|nr:hypothetical protein [Undibacterium sp. YM2]BBB66856.1 hypothetical protein UNDYM_2603 [Undibacterium sp. YM2]